MIRLNRTFVLSVLLAIVGFVGISSAQKLEIKTNQAEKVDFKAIKTYAWLPPFLWSRTPLPTP